VLFDNVKSAFQTHPDRFVPKCHQALLWKTFYISLNLPRISIIIGELDHPHKRKNSSSLLVRTCF